MALRHPVPHQRLPHIPAPHPPARKLVAENLNPRLTTKQTKRPNTQTPKLPNSPTPQLPNSPTPKLPNTQTPKHLLHRILTFKHVYTGVDKTVKRAIPLKAIKKIKNLDLSLHPALDFARDMFLFSFYTRGMSFIDMAHLKKKDLQNGILSYRRRKTGQQLFIKWEKCMQEITDKHKTDYGSPYLLPILKYPYDNRSQYKNVTQRIENRYN